MGIKTFILTLLLTFGHNIWAQQAIVLKDNLRPIDKEFKVLIMLPFCIGINEKYKIREKMLEYYEGIEIAIQELEKTGVKMAIEVVDTKSDSLEVINILSKPEYQSFDLIFGPIYDNEYVEVQKFCSIYNIPLVSPLRYFANTLGAEFPLINFISNDSMEYYYTGQHAANAFKKYQVIVVDENINVPLKGAAGRNFKKGYDLTSGQSCIISDGKTSINSLWNQKDSLLIYYVGKSSNTCNKALANKGHSKWKVAGPADWLDIDRTNYTVFEDVYFYDQYAVPYNDTTYKKFRLNFRKNYGGDPAKYTFVGYDQFLFIGTALATFDKYFITKILNCEFNYTHTTFNFVKRGNLYENAGVNLFYFQDYKFYKAFWRY